MQILPITKTPIASIHQSRKTQCFQTLEIKSCDVTIIITLFAQNNYVKEEYVCIYMTHTLA